jgi:hypothetical protein
MTEHVPPAPLPLRLRDAFVAARERGTDSKAYRDALRAVLAEARRQADLEMSER